MEGDSVGAELRRWGVASRPAGSCSPALLALDLGPGSGSGRLKAVGWARAQVPWFGSVRPWSLFPFVILWGRVVAILRFLEELQRGKILLETKEQIQRNHRIESAGR